jgi:hypothetical protein
LRIAGSPPGALVRVDGTKSAHLGEPIEGLALGKHTVVISADDYRSRTIPIELTSAAPEATPQVVLVRGRGELAVYHGPDGNVRVEIPGAIPKGQELERSFDNVAAGHYTAKITYGSRQWSKPVIVADGKKTKILFEDAAALDRIQQFAP